MIRESRCNELRQVSTLALMVMSVLFIECPSLFCRPPSSKGGTVCGRVVDSLTNTPLAGARVEVDGLDLHESTDKTGFYRLSGLAPGRYVLRAKYPGYQTAVRKDVPVSLSAAADVDFRLIPLDFRPREEMTVTAESIDAGRGLAVTRMAMDARELPIIPGSIGDVSRVLNTNPGTNRTSDLSNDLLVRGGSPWENGYYIDNMPISDINHFQRQGGSGGLVGVIDPDLIESLVFFTGGFSASYGDRMSSVLVMAFRNGDREKRRMRFALDAAGIGGRIESPVFGRAGSLIFSVRRNYHDLLAAVVGVGIAPRFGSANLKLTLDVNAKNRLTLMNIFGDSRLSYDLETALREGYQDMFNLKTGQNTAGVNWRAAWSPNILSDTSVVFSRFRGESTLSRVDGGESSAAEERLSLLCLRNVSRILTESGTEMELGFETKQEGVRFFNRIEEYINRWREEIPGYVLRGKLTTFKTAAFYSATVSPRRGWSATLGIRGDYFSYSGRFHLSPRFAVSRRIGESFLIKGGAGLYVQALPAFLVSGGDGNRKNRNPRARHLLWGMEWNSGETFRITLDAYHKRYEHMPLAPEDPTYFVMDSGVDYGYYRAFDVLSDAGRAAAAGVETTARFKPNRKISVTLAGTYSRSRFRDGEGVWRNRINDNRYLVTALGHYTTETWVFRFRWNLAGGVPYPPFDETLSREFGVGILNIHESGIFRYPAYHTLNIRAERSFPVRAARLKLYLEIMNAYNRKNVDRYYWNAVKNRIDTFYQAPLLPVFGLEIEF